MKRIRQARGKRVDYTSAGVSMRLLGLVRRQKVIVIIISSFVIAYGIPVVVHRVDDLTARLSLPGVLPELRSNLAPTRTDVMGESATRSDRLVDRTQDSRPLRAEEVFPDRVRNVSYESLSLKLQGIGVTNNCINAFWGQRLAAAVKSGDCSQIIRGLYVDENRKSIGFICVLNMRDASAAKQIAELLGRESSDGFVYSLQAAGNFGEFRPGYSLASTHSIAHYVFVSWAQRVDRAEPPAGDNELIHALVALESAASALSRRASEPQD